ncbi:hypothetical protein P6709_20240, partial [Jeotgalibacillus sp. ET6]|uniref:hypothetical protein n=1 Tax=Jeotgalibacillus sp. ET6 TaxID=3037260 RepID=UPI002418AFE4
AGSTQAICNVYTRNVRYFSYYREKALIEAAQKPVAAPSANQKCLKLFDRFGCASGGRFPQGRRHDPSSVRFFRKKILKYF